MQSVVAPARGEKNAQATAAYISCRDCNIRNKVFLIVTKWLAGCLRKLTPVLNRS